MREGVAERKVPGGKFVRVRAYLTDDCSFTDLVVEGDFFAYPPDAIDGLAERVRGKALAESLKAIDEALKGISLGGLDARTIRSLVEESFRKACGDGG